MEDERRQRLRAGWAAVAVGATVFSGKLAAWGVTGSAAVFGDAMESVVNVAAAGLLLVSLFVAARPADADHPYGHGKIEYFSAGIEGTLIAVAAILIAVEAFRALLTGATPHKLDLGLGLVVGMSVLNAALGVYLVRVGRRTSSVALEADGRHVLADVWTSAGVVVGVAGVGLTGWAPLDPIVAFGVAFHVLREGWQLARGAAAGLMDAADEGLLGALTERLQRHREPSWIDVHGLRAWRSGADVHVDLHLVVPRYYDADALHRIHDEIEAALAPTVRGGDVVAHFDPCRPHDCKTCAMPSCPVRTAPFERAVALRPERAVRGDDQVPH